MAFNKPAGKPAAGPDPEVMGAIQHLSRTKLEPLQEVMFKAWADANQVQDPDGGDSGYDFRKVFQDTEGKVQPPGQVQDEADMQGALEILMRAQEEHEKNSPLKLFQEAVSMQGEPDADDHNMPDQPQPPVEPSGMPMPEEQASQMPPMGPPQMGQGGPEGPMPPGVMDQMLGAGGL